MAWFRLDDKFHGHPKVILAGNAAIGLYVRCGAYASDHLTNGFIAAHVARNLGNRREIATLVNAGLWAVVDGGYRMPDYLEYNPSAADVEAERAAARERMRKAREAKRSGSVRANNERSSPEVRKCSDNPHPTPPQVLSLVTSVGPLPVSDAGAKTVDPFEVPRDKTALVAAIRQHRPDWNEAGIKTAIRDAQGHALSWRQAVAAMIAVTIDPASKTPGRVKTDSGGFWWNQLQPADTRTAAELIAAFAAKGSPAPFALWR